MPADARDAAHLWDMLDAAREAVGYVGGLTFSAFERDRRTRRAVERCVEIVGEAARKVSRDFEAEHPEVPWQKIVAMRHVLAHEYGEVQDEILWRVATVHLPALVAQIEPLVPELPRGDEGNG